ncbi:S-layer homology domain-containing protein [Cohnella cellulosilytica]|uniref:S-layer homology domain-containing protein n=1 Tax=Cohnella cellulosilytica TaxID=986710 RepID=A0ABW2FF64_9BACL
MDKLSESAKKWWIAMLIAGLLGASFPYPAAHAAMAEGGYSQPPWKEVDHSSPGPEARFASAMAYDEDSGNTLLFGGVDVNHDDLDDTWMWDGRNWTDVTPADPGDSPVSRIYAEMAYAGPGKGMLLFGGNIGPDISNETWVWDGTKWHNATPADTTANYPPGRTEFSMAYIGGGEILLYGGWGEGGDLNDTWIWNGTSWREATPADPNDSPTTINRTSIAYDQKNDQVVLFGGYTNNAPYVSSTTWIWDGLKWNLQTPAVSPPPRVFASMAYDSNLEKVILVGGEAGYVPKDDVWFWDGTNWTEQTEANLPQLSLSNMVFDSRRGQSVLFSGYSEYYLFEKTWTQRISSVANVGVVGGSNAAEAAADWIVEFETGVYGELAGGSDTITLHAPTGTILPASSLNYAINGAVSASVLQNTAEEATIALSQNVPANTRVSVAVKGVINPPAGSYAPGDFTMATSQDIVAAPAASGLRFLVPDHIAVETTPVSAWTRSSVSVTGVVYDSAELPVSGVEVEFAAASGSFGTASATTDANGRFSTVYTTPAAAGDVTITAALHADSSVAGTALVRVNARPGGGSGSGSGGGTSGSEDPPTTVEDPVDPPGTPDIPDIPGTPDVPGPGSAFVDIAGHWAEAAILDAARKGIVTGYPDGTYRPDRAVTRAEFAVMLAKALQLRNEAAAIPFQDADRIGLWARAAVAQAVSAGLIRGNPDGSFRPDALITRSEMAVMLARALTVAADARSAGFADDRDIPEWAVGAAAEMKRLGIMRGKGGNGFFPKDAATRGEAAAVLLKTLAAMARE